MNLARRSTPNDVRPATLTHVAQYAKQQSLQLQEKRSCPKDVFGISASVYPETAPQAIGSSNVLPPAPWLAATVNVLLIQAACIAGLASAMRLS